MKPIAGFIGGAYTSRSLPASAQRTLNMFVEKSQQGGIAEMLVGTPGLRLLYTMPTGPSRGAITMKGRSFRVGGATLYETTSGNANAIGTLSTGTGAVSMATNGTQIVLVDGVAGYLYDSAFSIIADPEFPNGVTRVGWEGNIFVVCADGTQTFEASGLGTGATWDGLDFASAENKPENIVSFIVSHDRLLFLTRTGGEQWVNTGNAEFTFERDNGSSIEVGCEARDSLVTMNNGVYWLGCDDKGGGIVFSLQGGVPQRISTHAIETEIQRYSVRSDAVGMAYQQEGHFFYVLTFPTAEKTWAYDAATQEWAERCYLQPNTQQEMRWRPRDLLFARGLQEAGDYENGNVYALDLGVFTDNGQTIKRVRSCPPIAPFARMTFSRFAVDAEMGTVLSGSPHLRMRHSNDGGKTYNDPRVKSLGEIGETGKRAVFFRCGTMREGGKRVFEVSITDPVKVAIYGAWMDATVDQ